MQSRDCSLCGRPFRLACGRDLCHGFGFGLAFGRICGDLCSMDRDFLSRGEHANLCIFILAGDGQNAHVPIQQLQQGLIGFIDPHGRDFAVFNGRCHCGIGVFRQREDVRECLGGLAVLPEYHSCQALSVDGLEPDHDSLDEVAAPCGRLAIALGFEVYVNDANGNVKDLVTDGIRGE